ncbi:N-acetylmuramoyl-L-alanine amidase family protein [Candidatus Synchoanobacter obligatus]|uniref:N-acetylmuramoyl-L-alanine amidase n=1 Tax=Candidatus Synchoanobacter obligatus TaxID=2919597 RepID=A0ABT1L391_9GAMM|nr:N-acetylmuramoyl-L-alanine amidase [Candidatus Synchoanobacter obligatus]MCP8351701.1 N-acetylmuramoyl-L-alanine amidase [Candidatus Synchoanobacter obligatus]
MIAYLVLILLAMTSMAHEQYVFQDVESDVVVQHIGNILIVKSSQPLTLMEQPRVRQYSYLADCTDADCMWLLRPGTRYLVRQDSDRLVVDYYGKEEKKSQIHILLDPGHGGKDPGAISKDGLLEKDLVLAYAKLVADCLNSIPGLHASLTREVDRYLDKYDRLKMAIAQKPDYFLSIHADAYLDSQPKGMGVYYIDNSQGSSQSQGLLAKEDVSQKSVVIEEAQALAIAFLQCFQERYDLHTQAPKPEPFVVLRSPYTPSLLMELGFISNREEAEKLADEAYQMRLAKDIAGALKAFIYQKEGLIHAGAVD